MSLVHEDWILFKIYEFSLIIFEKTFIAKCNWNVAHKLTQPNLKQKW